MFLKKYKQFKSIFKDESLYENKSFGKGGLFHFEEMELETDEVYISSEDIETFFTELERTRLKYSFVKSFLDNELLSLEKENKRLDDEYFKMNNMESSSGNSFLKMMNLENANNHVINSNVSYIRNAKLINDKVYSSNEKITEVQFYIEHQSEYNLFMVFEKLTKIKECIIEFHKDIEYSLFGVKEDGTMESIFVNINSKDNNFLLINGDEEFSKLFMISNQNTKNTLKNIRAFTTKESFETGVSIVCYKLDGLTDLEKIEFSSTSASKIYLFNLKKYKDFLKDITENEEDGLFKHLNERNRIEKNIQMEAEGYDDTMFIVERLEQEQRTADILNVYGVEK